MKNDTFASTKFLLAALGLAFVKAGQVLVEESSKLDAMDAELDGPTVAVSVPTAAAPQITAADIANAQRDKNGLPWDERIHSGSKTINADGTWKKRKGVSDTIVDAVTAELRATCGLAAPAASNDGLLTGTGAASPPMAAITVPAPPAIAVPTVIAPPAPVSTPYTQLCDFLAKNTGDAHALNDAWIAKFFEVNGTTLPALATDLDKSDKLLATLRETLTTAGITEVK